MRIWRPVTGALFFILCGVALASAQGNCPGASPFDNTPDDPYLNTCLAAGGVVELVPGSPGYLIAHTVSLRANGTTLRGTGGKATLIAAPSLYGPILRVFDNLQSYEISELIVDGNVGARTRRDDCVGYRDFGSNMIVRGDYFVIHHIDTINAMCGSAMEVAGSNFQLYSIYAANNGRTKFESPLGVDGWSDGITLLRCDGGWVHNNWMIDNTDIGIVVGSGTGCTIESNEIRNPTRYAFAGFALGTFLGATSQPGALYRYNLISSGYNQQAFGMVLGYHPWSNPANLFDLGDVGTIRENSMTGAVVNLAIDGIGAGLVTGNTFSGAQGNDGFNCSLSSDYTAADFGSTSIQGGWIYRIYHGVCSS